MKALEINNLSKTYKNSIFKKKFRVLKNVCFNIDTGSIVGLVGPNGAGKSTAVKIILNLIIPTSGNIIISGEDHHNKNVRKKIGYLPETDKYPMYLTGNQFLKICSNFYKKKINKKKIKDLEIKLGLSQKLDLTINKYSKGMRKKLGFIQALQFEPELLILDEPIEGLDTEGKKVIVDILKDFKSNGNSVLINSHYLSELEKIDCNYPGLHCKKGQVFFESGKMKLAEEEFNTEISLTKTHFTILSEQYLKKINQ